MAKEEPYFTIDGRRFVIYSKDEFSERRLEIISSSTTVYVAVWEYPGSGTVQLLNINVDHDDFIDAMVVMFPELTRK